MLRNIENIQSSNVCKDTVDKSFGDTADWVCQKDFGCQNWCKCNKNVKTKWLVSEKLSK